MGLADGAAWEKQYGVNSKTDFAKEKFELKSKFTEDFFKEFQYDAEFQVMFESMVRGLTPYEVIEHLCKSKKELFQSFETAIKVSNKSKLVEWSKL